MRNRARWRPSESMAASSDWSHSRVSSGSMSGSWLGKPSVMMLNRSRVTGTISFGRERSWRVLASSQHLRKRLGSPGELPRGIAGLPAISAATSSCPPAVPTEEDAVVSTTPPSATGNAERLGLKPGMIVMESGYDDDVDDELRDGIAEVIGEEMVDEDTDEVVDVVLLWYRDGDGDLADVLVD